MFTLGVAILIMRNKQSAAKNFSDAFAPRTSLGLFVRNLVIAATTIPG